mmetsp:Transcript_46669/g.52203  ORF Transcript_46669/g.52203 Transcript_46669/m.52203 type:complete len:84 (+) Transcript_46669:446-697(+)
MFIGGFGERIKKSMEICYKIKENGIPMERVKQQEFFFLFSSQLLGTELTNRYNYEDYCDNNADRSSHILVVYHFNQSEDTFYF